MKRFGAAFALVVLAMMMLAAPASAGRAWCAADPVAVVDGKVADIKVASSLDALFEVTGPNKLVLVVPEGVNGWFLLSDLGFGRGYNLDVEHSSDLQKTWRGTEIMIKVYVPAKDDSLPVTVTYRPHLLGLLNLTKAASVSGSSNEWLTLSVTM
jgi:hypothetical protein